MPALLKHIDSAVRVAVPLRLHYILCLDGHSSQNRTSWIDMCRKNNCELFVSPANTSHFPQPCDQNVNKGFNFTVRELRDELCKSSLVNTRHVSGNLSCGVHAFESITVHDIVQSFLVIGTYPFDCSLPSQFNSNISMAHVKASKDSFGIASCVPTSSVASVRKRSSDRETLSEVGNILKTPIGSSEALQKLSIAEKYRNR